MSNEVLAEAYVRLRALADGSFEKEAHDSIVPAVGRIAGDAARVVAAAKIFSIAKDGLAELSDAQGQLAVTEAHIKSTGGAANVTADQVTNLAGALSGMSGVDDEVIQGGENMLLTFKRVRNELGEGNQVFDRATAAALDMSKSGFGSVESASVLLGKALDDPIKGVTALQRVGVALTESQKEQVKAFVASGDVLSAQKVILGEVESQVGGTAKAYGETVPGQVDKATESWKNAKGELVAGFAPAITLAAQVTKTFADTLQGLPDPAKEAIGAVALLGGGVASLARPVSDIVGLYTRWKASQMEATEATAADVGVQEADAAAAETNAAAHGGLSGALGKAGVVAAAAAATIGLYEYGKSLNKTTLSTEELKKLTEATPEQLGKVAGELVDLANKGGAFGGALDDTLQKLLAMGDSGVGAISKMRDAVAAAGGDTSKFDAALTSAKTAQGNLNTNVDTGRKVLDGASVSAKDYATAVKTLEDAILGLTGNVMSEFEAQLRLSDAQVSSRAALADLTKVTKDHKASEDDRTSASNKAYEAILDEAKANEDLYLATHTAADGTRDAVGANKALVTELLNVAGTLDDGSPLKQQLNGYIWQLSAAAAKANEPEKLSLDTSDATQAAIAWFNFINNLSSPLVTFHASTGGNLSQRAAGGPVRAGEMFQGGEAGRELALLNTNGLYQLPTDAMVFNNADTERMLGGSSAPSGMSVTMNLTLNAPNYVGDKSDLVAALTDRSVAAALTEMLRRGQRELS